LKFSNHGDYQYLYNILLIYLFQKNNCPFSLMHCNSTYPLNEEDANLLCITSLKKHFNCEVGYSGHETDLYSISEAAVILGATSIERHITLDRSMYGSDQPASVEVHALKKMVTVLRLIPTILGDGKKRITEKEMKIRKKLRIEIN